MIKKWKSFNESSEYLESITDAFQDISDEYVMKIDNFSNDTYVVTIDTNDLNVEGDVDIDKIPDAIQKINSKVDLLNLISSSIRRADPIRQTINLGINFISITMEYSDTESYFSIGSSTEGFKKYTIYRSKLKDFIKNQFGVGVGIDQEAEKNLYIFIEDGTNPEDNKIKNLINMIKKDLKDIVVDQWLIEEDDEGPNTIVFELSPYNDPNHTGEEIVIEFDD